MKPLHKNTTVLETTARQRKAIAALQREHLEDGGALFAQAYPDGVRIRVLTKEQSDVVRKAFAQALGTPDVRRMGFSAFSDEAHP